MRSIVITAAALALLIAPAISAQAQTAPAAPTPARARGTVLQLEEHALKVRAREGQEVTFGLPDGVNIRGVARRTLADIKAGDFTASTSVRGQDGRLHAVEVHLFPEGPHPNENQFGSDLVPDGIMTNATAAGVTSAPTGGVIKVMLKGAETEIVIDRETEIVQYVAGDRSLLKPGAAVVVIGQKQPDGTLVAGSVVAEKDGVKPPM